VTKKILLIPAVFAILFSLIIGMGCSKSVAPDPINDSISPFINYGDHSTSTIYTTVADVDFNGNELAANVFVQSQDGFSIIGLFAGNFTILEIYEDGSGGEDTAEILFEDITIGTLNNAGNENYLSLVLLRSMTSEISGLEANLQTAMLQTVTTKDPSDSFAILAFHSYDTLLVNFTRNIALLENAINEISYWGRSAQFMAINRAIAMLANQGGNKGMIIFGDGVNNESPYDQAAIITAANNANVPIYFVVFGDLPDTSNIENIANQTGAFYSYQRGRASYRAMINEMRGLQDNIYQIKWNRATPSGRRGRVEISTVYQSAIGISSTTALYYFEAP